MGEVQDMLAQKEAQLVQFVINKVAPNMLDMAKGMCEWIKKGNPKQGEQTLEQLEKHGEALSSLPLNSANIKQFTAAARKHGIDFTIDTTNSATTVYFKAKDTEAMTNAFQDYTNEVLNQAKSKKMGFKEKMAEAKKEKQEQNREQDKDKNRDKTKNKGKGGR